MSKKKLFSSCLHTLSPHVPTRGVCVKCRNRAIGIGKGRTGPSKQQQSMFSFLLSINSNHIQIMPECRQQIEAYSLIVTIYIGHIALPLILSKDIHRMSTTKTKLITKPICLKELRQLLKTKLGPSQISKRRIVSKHDLRRVLNSQYTECQICYNTLVEPVTLSCGHSCCLECLQEGSLLNGRCSFCKQCIVIKQIFVNKAMQRFVRCSLALLGGDHRKKYIQRQLELKIRQKLRRINMSSLQVGDDIDYRDFSRMRWVKGSVMQVQRCKGHNLIYVEFSERHKSSSDFEIYQSSSMNIAPAGYFSKRMVPIRPIQPRQQASLRINHSIRTQLSSNAHYLHPILSAN